MEPRRKAIAILSLMIVVGCADTGPPPGGPEDKAGPTVLLTQPANGAVSQTDVKTVRIEFSERVTMPGQGSSVFISPRPTRPPKISWGAKSLTIQFADTLAANRTYVISVPGLLTDLHGNRPDTSVSLAFSTGPILDSGKIAGVVMAGDKAASGVTVALYESAGINPSVPIDSIYPDYLTLTGSNGEFQFRNLPDGRFRLIAYQKSGRDDRFKPTRQKFAVPDRDIDVGGALSLDHLNMTLTSQDTNQVKISSAAFTPDGIVQLRFSSPVSRRWVDSSTSSLLVSVGGTDIRALAVIPSDSDLVNSVQAYFGRLPQGVGSITWQFDSSRPALVFDSLKVSPVADTGRPVILAFFPSADPLLTADTALHFRFSEPIDTSLLADSVLVLKTLKDSAVVKVSRSMPNLFELVLRADSLKVGGGYQLVIDEDGVKDLAGNALGDSLRSYAFSILPPDSLGWITGSAQVFLKSDSLAGIGLTFRHLLTGRKFHWHGKRGAFQVPLPGGKYVITGFVDRNANRRFDGGAIFPYTPAETQLRYIDTVAVRARFETAGVDLEFK
ncbi:MAG: Ig-like domain-containing protein [candidate division Zixibacteria bacterium]|nr:Ig-like domain-containing protein [candidate division Zixibacteria bacterium]